MGGFEPTALALPTRCQRNAKLSLLRIFSSSATGSRNRDGVNGCARKRRTLLVMKICKKWKRGAEPPRRSVAVLRGKWSSLPSIDRRGPYLERPSKIRRREGLDSSEHTLRSSATTSGWEGAPTQPSDLIRGEARQRRSTTHSPRAR